MSFNPRTEVKRVPMHYPDFGEKGKPGTILSHHQWLARKAKLDAKHTRKTLKPLPSVIKPLGKKLQYYIEFWKLGENEMTATTFWTANLRNAVSLIMKSGKYSVTFIKRLNDNKIIWDQKH
jgi:hypothetical protein